MDRLTSGVFAPDIRLARSLVPWRMHSLVSCDFLTGVDPVFAGLHDYTTTADGRSYRSTPHCAYLHHQARTPRSRRRTTVVLPAVTHWSAVVHELGHVLHESLGFGPVAEPVSAYAATDRYEAFAEAFTAWLIPHWHHDRPDARTLALFDRLELGG